MAWEREGVHSGEYPGVRKGFKLQIIIIVFVYVLSPGTLGNWENCFASKELKGSLILSLMVSRKALQSPLSL